MNTKITPSCFNRKYTKKVTPRELWCVPRVDKNRIQREQMRACDASGRRVVAPDCTLQKHDDENKKCVQKINKYVSRLDVGEENVTAFIKR